MLALAHAGLAQAQPAADELDELDDYRITFGPLMLSELPPERDDRWSVHAQLGGDARGDRDGGAAGGELGLGAELHRGTAECIRSIDLSGQVRGGAGDLPRMQYSARAQGCFAGWHILRELNLGADGNILPPLSLGRGLRSLPVDRLTWGGGFAMLSVAIREGSVELMPGTFEYEHLGQQAPGEPDTHFGNMDVALAMFAMREAGADGGFLELLYVSFRQVEQTTAGPGAVAFSFGPLRMGGKVRGGFRIEGELGVEVGDLRLMETATGSEYLTVTTAGGQLGVDHRGADHLASLRYRRGFTPATREIILEDRVDASLSLPRGPSTLGLRSFAAWTQAWSAPEGPQHRGLTGGAAIDWTRALPHRSQLAVSAELARSYYAHLGPEVPTPTTGARVLVLLATELAGSR